MPPKYKPGGKKFPPKASAKSLPKQVVNNPSTSSLDVSASSGLDPEAENRFELELCWCIQQLQLSLDSGKLSEKQSLDSLRTLNLLKSNTVALIRKRQAMRNTFGDYRTKMNQEEKKHGRYVSNFKFSGSNADANKSLFLRKATPNLTIKNGLDEDISQDNKSGENNDKKTFIMSKELSESPFRFNFCKPEPE